VSDEAKKKDDLFEAFRKAGLDLQVSSRTRQSPAVAVEDVGGVSTGARKIAGHRAPVSARQNGTIIL
jgi:hypothetical protein